MINRDLQKIETWSTKLKVTFNADKSKDIIFSNKVFANQPDIVFNNETIKRVTILKQLGVILSVTLGWTEQINYICLRANRKFRVLSVKYLNRLAL